MNNWKQDFILQLIEYYKIFKENGENKLQPTSNIKGFTAETKDENDIFKQYVSENLKSAETHIHTKTIYDHFCNWLKNNNYKINVNNKKLNNELRKLGYVIEHNIHIDEVNLVGIKNLQIC